MISILVLLVWYLIHHLGSQVSGLRQPWRWQQFRRKKPLRMSIISITSTKQYTNHKTSVWRTEYKIRWIKKVLCNCRIAGLLWVCYGSYLWLSVKNVIINFFVRWKLEVHPVLQLWQMMMINNKEFSQKRKFMRF